MKKNKVVKEREHFELLFQKIEWEGFDYCFTDYSEWEEIKDKKFQKLRTAYVKAHEELQSFISEMEDKFQLEDEENEEEE